MERRERNYAFIDTQNMSEGILRQGWRIDYARFRRFLREKYQVEKAFLFMGYLEKNRYMYRYLESVGFIIIFKQVILRKNAVIKGNCDVDLTLRACLEFWNFDRAVIVTGDGDFFSLVDSLETVGKLRKVLIPDSKRFSELYTSLRDDRIDFMDNLREKIAVNEKGPSGTKP